jgi:hypothetical protein
MAIRTYLEISFKTESIGFIRRIIFYFSTRMSGFGISSKPVVPITGFIIIAALFSAGCQSVEGLREKYGRVAFGDGINFMEARAVAQHVMLNSPYTESFDIFKPYIMINAATEAYPNFWFVSFPPKDSLSSLEYLVVIDKRSGGVIRQRSYAQEQKSQIDIFL